MKRTELQALLGEIDKSVIDKIMDMNGLDIEATKAAYADDLAELATYREGGKNFITASDREFLAGFKPDEYAAAKNELDELRKFKSDLEQKTTQEAKNAAVEKLLEAANYDKKVVKLLATKVFEYEPEFDDSNALKNGDAILTKLAAEYGDFKVVEKDGTFNPAPDNGGKKTETDPFVLGFTKG